MKKKALSWILPGMIVLALDQALKIAFASEAIQNSGMAFGMFRGNPLTILLFSLILIGLCAFFLKRAKISGLGVIALSMMAGGALGNMIDRVARGYVIDLFPFFNWFVFNVADVGVVAGAALCAFSLLFRPQDWSKR